MDILTSRRALSRVSAAAAAVGADGGETLPPVRFLQGVVILQLITAFQFNRLISADPFFSRGLFFREKHIPSPNISKMRFR
jgi:hypothetical protein